MHGLESQHRFLVYLIMRHSNAHVNKYAIDFHDIFKISTQEDISIHRDSSLPEAKKPNQCQLAIYKC